MRTVALAAIAALTLFVSTEAWACSVDRPYFKLPSETEGMAAEKNEALNQHLWVFMRLSHQEFLFENAQTIYVAERVPKPGPNPRGADEIVAPPSGPFYVRLKMAVKGELPTSDLQLHNEFGFYSGLCVDGGDGSAWRAQFGDPIIVFEGVPSDHSYYVHPRGNFSILARDLLHFELALAIQQYLYP